MTVGETSREPGEAGSSRSRLAPPLTALDHVRVCVSDWERSNRFYVDVLGAQLIEQGKGHWAYRIADTLVNVLGPDNPRRPGLHLCFEWSGPAEDAYAHLVAHGVEVLEGPVPRLGSRGTGISVFFRDPDGTLLEFMSYAPTDGPA